MTRLSDGGLLAAEDADGAADWASAPTDGDGETLLLDEQAVARLSASSSDMRRAVAVNDIVGGLI